MKRRLAALRPTACAVQLSLIAAAVLALWPGAAGACPVCMSNQAEASRNAFIATTGFLTVLPLLMVGGLAWWIRRRSRELARAETRTSLEPDHPELTRASS